ncbi:TonB-dependent receptor [Altererythrobacter sp. Root672]|nr:TonB-dependent receptor [Altererythrobacter sp. Root672]
MRLRSAKTTRRLAISLLAGSSLAAVTPAAAQDEPGAAEAPASSGGNVIIVTAQKREQNLQDVPIAITALGNEQLSNLQVSSIEDAVRFLPSVTIQTLGPGFSQLYFRGVASGENANHSASLPTVGTYLDEMPVTTIQGSLDIHAYDINRIEALAGPQGTLYGASSMAGTLRIITNQPDVGSSYGAVDLELNSVAHGGTGGMAEGFYNLPISDSAAVRVVGWYTRDAGYIDNIHGTRTFPIKQFVDDDNDPDTDDVLVDLPGDDITQDNASLVENNYNDVETFGGRIALGIDLNDSWTLRPTIMGQSTKAHGFFEQERSSATNDRLQVVQYNPEYFKDEWVQAALTIEGTLGNWDLVTTGGYLWRNDEVIQDYSDYSYFYDALAGYASYLYDNAGEQISPNQYIQGADKYRRMFGEVRIASPAENRLRVIGGLFAQRQEHHITQHYIIDDLADVLQVTGTTDNIWLTEQKRTDRDYAVFGEVSYDLMDDLTLTGGVRVYNYKNSLVGFFGYGAGYSGSTGESQCFAPAVVEGSPCTNLDKTTSDTDFIHKLNLTYKITPDIMTYATWSRGFRPGGINRRGTLPPYGPDELDNYELGLKTTFGDVRFNLAVYQQDWNGIQLSFIGANGLTEIRNAGIARIRGAEFDFGYYANGVSLSLGGSYNDADIRRDFCAIANDEFDCTTPTDNELLAPAGTRLPTVPKFKGNFVARYEIPVFNDWTAHVQGAATYVGDRRSDLRTLQNEIKGTIPSYATADFSIGISNDTYRLELYATNLFDGNGRLDTSLQCQETVCGDPDGLTAGGGVFYDAVIRPRVVGLKFGSDF